MTNKDNDELEIGELVIVREPIEWRHSYLNHKSGEFALVVKKYYPMNGKANYDVEYIFSKDKTHAFTREKLERIEV